MDKQTEKRIDEVGKELTKEIKKEVEKKVDKEVQQKVEEQIQQVQEKVEKKVEEQIQQVQQKFEKDVDKKVDEKVEKKVDQEFEKRVEKEFKKRIYEVIYEKTINSAILFKKEFKEQIVIAVTAAFAFLIALSWRHPIQKSVEKLIEKLNLTGGAIYIEYLSALTITLIAALFLMIISRWKSDMKSHNKKQMIESMSSV